MKEEEKKAFRIHFPPCCVKKGDRAGRRVLHPSPVQHPSPVPDTPQGFKQGVALIPTQLHASLDLPRGKIELMQTRWEKKVANGLWVGIMTWQRHPGSSELGGLAGCAAGWVKERDGNFYAETTKCSFFFLKESNIMACPSTSFEGIQNLHKREIKI